MSPTSRPASKSPVRRQTRPWTRFSSPRRRRFPRACASSKNRRRTKNPGRRSIRMADRTLRFEKVVIGPTSGAARRRRPRRRLFTRLWRRSRWRTRARRPGPRRRLQTAHRTPSTAPYRPGPTGPCAGRTSARSLVPNPTNSRARARDFRDLARLGIIYAKIFFVSLPGRRDDITDDEVIAFARRPCLGSTYNMAAERFGQHVHDACATRAPPKLTNSPALTGQATSPQASSTGRGENGQWHGSTS